MMNLYAVPREPKMRPFTFQALTGKLYFEGCMADKWPPFPRRYELPVRHGRLAR